MPNASGIGPQFYRVAQGCKQALPGLPKALGAVDTPQGRWRNCVCVNIEADVQIRVANAVANAVAKGRPETLAELFDQRSFAHRLCALISAGTLAPRSLGRVVIDLMHEPKVQTCGQCNLVGRADIPFQLGGVVAAPW